MHEKMDASSLLVSANDVWHLSVRDRWWTGRKIKEKKNKLSQLKGNQSDRTPDRVHEI